MKKLVIKCLLMVGIMVGISNYALYIMTGKMPFDSVPNISFSAPSQQDLRRSLSDGKETVYKWTDAQGKIHYSSEPPQNQRLAKKLEVNPDANLIQGLAPQTPQKPEPKPAQPASVPGGVNAYNPAAVKKLVDDAKNVQNLLNERNEATQKALQNL